MSTLIPDEILTLLVEAVGRFTDVEATSQMGIRVVPVGTMFEVQVYYRETNKRDVVIAKCPSEEVARAFGALYEAAYSLLVELQGHRAAQGKTGKPVRVWFIDGRTKARRSVSFEDPIRTKEEGVMTIFHLLSKRGKAWVCDVAWFNGTQWIEGEVQTSNALVLRKMIVEVLADPTCATAALTTLPDLIRSETGRTKGILDTTVTVLTEKP